MKLLVKIPRELYAQALQEPDETLKILNQYNNNPQYSYRQRLEMQMRVEDR